jgi:hypothetical protein
VKGDTRADGIDLDDRFVSHLRQAISRRRLLQRAMTWSLASGIALGTSLEFASTAEAGNCSYYGIVGTWGCTCASTANCPSCSSGNCLSGHKRCTYWTHANSAGQYCWCSNRCYNGSTLGHYTCCDCWTSSSSSCGHQSGSPCICRQWHSG